MEYFDDLFQSFEELKGCPVEENNLRIRNVLSWSIGLKE